MSWTTPIDLHDQVMKLWKQGGILTSLVTNEALFPRRLSLICPTATDMAKRFDEVRAWVQALQTVSHCRIETRSFRHRLLGNNAVPAEAWIDHVDDAVAMIGKRREVERFAALQVETAQRQPEWLAWLSRKPLMALALADDWGLFLDIAEWCRKHKRPGIYLRQIDLPGIHTKFIEAHRGVLIELLDLALVADAIDPTATGASRFNARYGFREKPARIRIRLLDEAGFRAWPGDDITMTADAFAKLDPPASRIFITENEINFLAFPPVNDAIIIFGAGYGFALLNHAEWLKGCRIQYWGDIDTHGFAILDQLRHRFDHVESLLMDEATFMAFKDLWGMEAAPLKRDLDRLTMAERDLYNGLRDNRYGQNLRLEQEKIGFTWVEAAIGS